MRRVSCVLPIAFLALLLFAAPGWAATTRYVAPTAQGTGDCSAPSNACTLPTGVTNATVPGDVVVLTAGSYSISTFPFLNPGVTMQAAADVHPTVAFAGSSFLSLSNGTAIRGFQISGVTTGGSAVVSANGGGVGGSPVVDRMRIINTAGGLGLDMSSPAFVTDSVITSSGSGEVNAVLGRAGEIRNSTIIATSTSFDSNAIKRTCPGSGTSTFDLQVHNTIMKAVAGYRSPNPESPCTLTGVINYSYSGTGYFNPAHVSYSNLIGEPLLIDSLGVESPLSSTVDQGSAAYVTPGETDLFGDPRVYGVAPDAGADEYYVAPPPGGGGDTTKPVISGLKAKKKKGKLKTFDFSSSEAGTATLTFTKKKGKKYKKAGSQTKAVKAGKNSIKPKKLKKGSYKLSLKVKDAAGNISSAKTLSFKIK